MKFITDGLVIREQNIKELDKIITILTRTNGIISAFVYGAKSIKSSKSAATGLLTYSRFVIFKNRERYIVDEADAQELFLPLRKDLNKLALAQYFCELAGELSPEEDSAESQLRLVLNGLYFLSKNDRPDTVVKCAFELRLLGLGGYMPNLFCCEGCGCYEHEQMCFIPETGSLVCGDCAANAKKECYLTGIAVTHAMRHCIFCEFKKLFAFNLSKESLERLEFVIEKYISCQINKKFKTLDFYKQMNSL